MPLLFIPYSTVTQNMRRVCISLDPCLPLRGDILIKCYHKKQRPSSEGSREPSRDSSRQKGSKGSHRQVMFRFQFHTCAITDDNLMFKAEQMDDAMQGKKSSEHAIDHGRAELIVIDQGRDELNWTCH